MKVILEKCHDDAIPYKEYFPGQAVVFELQITKHNNSKYWLKCFKCGLVGKLDDHEVKILDESITISPSIQCPNEKCDAHYYIINSEIS